MMIIPIGDGNNSAPKMPSDETEYFERLLSALLQWTVPVIFSQHPTWEKEGDKVVYRRSDFSLKIHHHAHYFQADKHHEWRITVFRGEYVDHGYGKRKTERLEGQYRTIWQSKEMPPWSPEDLAEQAIRWVSSHPVLAKA